MKKQPSLLLCIIMDAIGCASYIIPGIAESLDLIWAPVSAIIFFLLFGRKAAFGAVFNFAEEFLPGTDIIPTFTIAWVVRYLANKNKKPFVVKPQEKQNRLFG